jgi:hypothetical protein
MLHSVGIATHAPFMVATSGGFQSRTRLVGFVEGSEERFPIA